MSFLKNRRFQLESLEERTLLTAAPWSTGDGVGIETCIVVTDAVPVVAQVDDPTTSVGEGANVITEADVDDTIYVSVYCKSTDSAYGIQGGYCALYYSADGFTRGAYVSSSIIPNDTINDGYDYSKENTEYGSYISAFGGNPAGMTDSYGQTQWALYGTQEFTATAAGEYSFYNGTARNTKGNEKETWNFIREDLNQNVAYTSTSFTVIGDTPVTPDIEGVSVEGVEVVYDGSAYTVTVSGTEEGDGIFYSEDGFVYGEDAPAYSDVGTYDVFVKVTREGYNDWYGSADVVITPADIEGVSVEGVEAVYDGSAYTVTVSGAEEGDTVLYSTDGEDYAAEAPTFVFGDNTVYVKVQRANYNDWDGSAAVAIAAAPISVDGASVADKDYDGTTDAAITLGEVSGVVAGDDVTVVPAGAFPDSLPGTYEVGVTYSLEGDDAGYYAVADEVIVCTATINALDIDDVTVADVEVNFDRLPHTIEVTGLQEGDVVVYTYDGVEYDANPEFYGDADVDSVYEVSVKVSRTGYNDFTASATLTIYAAEAPEADSLVVTTLEDVVDEYDGLTSIREALGYAATFDEAVTVTFADNLAGTIALADCALVFEAENAITLDGGNVIVIDAQDASRVVEVKAGDVTLSGLFLTNGTAEKFGGAIFNAGNLTLNKVIVTDSYSGKYGGAVFTDTGSSLTVIDSVFEENEAKTHGGAVYVQTGALVEVSGSYFEENATGAYGAAFYMASDAVVTVENSIFTENEGPNGTIRNHYGLLALTNVVIVSNEQGLASSGGVNVGTNVTISDNVRSAVRGDEDASFTFYNSIVLSQKGLLNIDDTVTLDGDYNLSTKEFGTNYIAYDGGELFAEDGYTLWGENQAYNAGNNDYNDTEFDANGNARVVAEVIDLGATEQGCSAYGLTVTFDGSYQNLVAFDGPVTWAMYSEDGEDWTDELTYRNAGDYTIYVWCGNDYGDEETYTVTGTIAPLQLTVEGSYVKVKGADGTTDADVVVGDIATLYDDVTVSATGEFASAEIGVWDVAVSYSVSGDNAGNYIAPADETLEGEIKAKEAPSMVVTTADDVVDVTDGLISLREALTVYFGTDDCTTVTFAEGLTTINADSAFELSRAQNGLTIDGAGAIVFDGEDFTVFTLSEDADITFKGLTFQNINAGGSFGTAFSCGWGMQDDEWGKTVTFDHCSFLNNSATYGSVMMVTGTNVDVLYCTFTGNTGSDRGVIWSLYNNLYVEGSVFENNSGTGNGGALFVDTEGDNCKTLMVKESQFINNSTTGNGGAIYSSLETTKIYKTNFIGNHADGEGGAVYATHWGNAYFSALTPITLTLKYDIFEGNSSGANGGAIMVMAGNIQDLDTDGVGVSSVFKDNYATGALFNRGGAIYFDYGTGASNFNGTKFLNNSTPGDWAGMGGAVFTSATGFGTATDHQFNFNDCIFDGNQANAKGYYYAYGGAVYVGSGYNTFTNCTITNNAAYIADDSTGGGEVKGGAIYMVGGPDTRFYNCTLTNNYAGGNAEGSTWQKTQALGGAVYVGANALHFVQCQVTDNVAYGDNSRGGGVYVGEVGATIWWSTVAGNSAAAASDVYAGGAVSGLYSIIMDTVNKGAALGYTSCVYDSVEDASGTFTADAGCYKLQEGDALFALGGYALAEDSVAIDASGQANAWFNYDIIGNTRVGQGYYADCGAYEYQSGPIATGKTVVFDGTYQNLVDVDSRATWAMYSVDGEDWTDELNYRDAGEYTIYVWCGNDDGDEATYVVTGTITPLQLTVEGSYVKVKGYDGTTDADVVVGDVATLYDADVTVSATGEFASAEIGTWDVAVSYSVSGDHAGNYIAPADETLEGEIKAKEAPSMVVTTADDVVDATDGLISLREALTVYYGTDECTTVTFAEGLTTINVASAFELDASYDGLEIDGAGAIVFDGANFTIFQLSADADLTFTGLTFQNLNSDDFGGAFKAGWGCQDGNWGTVTFDSCTFQNITGSNAAVLMFTGLNGVVTNSTFTGNQAGSYGLIWDCWGNLTVEDSTFTNNSGGAICATADSGYTVKVTGSTFTGTTGGNGGAIQTEMSNLIIEDSVFENNSGNNGGAVYARNTSGMTVSISDSSFDGNTAAGAGGALFLEGATYAIDGCTFTGNTANGSFTDGGAILSSFGGECKISNSVFDGNTATGAYAGKGGAIHFTNQNGSVTITDSTFTGNQAYAPNYYWAWGGAIFRESGSGTLSLYNCSVVGNTAYAHNGGDGTLSANGGGIYMSGSGVLNLVQCLIADNEAISDSSPSYGGGLMIDENIGCAIYYTTIAGNSTSGTSNSTGGGIFNSGSTTIINSIVYGNAVPSDNLWDGLGADIWQNGGMAFQGVLYDAANIVGGYTVDDYCYAVQEGDSVFALGGYALAADSVAIDGTSRTTPPFNSYLHGKDLAGNDRVVNWSVDYGAFEYQGDLTQTTTRVFNGSYQNLFDGDSRATWVMYSVDGEEWTDELTYRNAGTYSFKVWAGNDDGQEVFYDVTGTITPLQLTVEGSYVKVKGADGTTDADVVVGTVATLYDDVTVSATGEFASAEIGIWDVAVSYSVSGDNAGNYIAPADETLEGEIKAKEAPSMVVTTADDVVDVTDGLISLREALTVYFGTDDCTTVTFAEGLTTINADSAFELSRAQNGLTIDGAGAIVFDGEDFTVFTLSEDADITFKGLTFQNINAGGSFGTAFACGWGMQDDEWGKTITFDSCSFLNNSAVYGSVMMVTGTNVDILNCTFTGNTGSDRGVIWSLYNNLYVGGSTFENNSGTGNGAALFVDTEGDNCKDLMVKDSAFINNSTTGNGGAIYSSLEVLKLYNCTFTNNHADGEGGAVYATHWGNAYFSYLTPIKVTLKNDVFEGNSSGANGGAIMVMAGNIQDVGDTGSVFTGNYTEGALFNRGGAIYFDYGTGASNFNGTQFLGNSASGDWAGMGGAVFTAATGFGTATDHQFNFNDCIFDGNLANPKGYYYAYGGAVYVGSGYNTFTDCTITNNAAYIADDSTGGGEVRGGAIYMVGGPDTRFYNCTLTNNYAGGNAEGSTWQKTQALGGAVYVGANSLHFIQCQVTDNVAYGDNSRGGGVYIGEVGSTIWWSTVAGNSAAAASDVYAGGAVSGLYSIIMDTVNKGAALAYTSCLYESVEDASGTFTADAGCYELQEGDPLFVLGGYELAPHSVAIDGTGQANGWFQTDLNGDPRVQGFSADYGAFEYQNAKLYVVVTFSDAIPNQEISDTVPVSTISEANAGDVVYAQVWVKNMDGSDSSVTGGYLDITYSDAVLSVVSADASSIFDDGMPKVDISVAGVVTDFGGLAGIEAEGIGVESWALLGTITFDVIGAGFAVTDATIPSFNGAPNEAFDLSREGEGAIADANIEYFGASLTANVGIPTITAVSSNGANRQELAWEAAIGADSYQVAYSTDGENWTTVTVEGTSAIISGLPYGATVTYKVAGISNGEVGDYSDTVSLNVCPMDINGDGTIDSADLAIFKAAYFAEKGDDNWNPAADIDGDGVVGPADYSYLRANWLADAGDDDLVYPPAQAELDAAFESLDADDLAVDIDVF